MSRFQHFYFYSGKSQYDNCNLFFLGCIYEKKFPFSWQSYQASVDDLKKVLLIDPNVLEAKKELEEITQLLSLGGVAVADCQQKQRKKITIQEVHLFIFTSRQYRSHTFENITAKHLGFSS